MSNYKKIIFTGGSGRFGSTFRKIHNNKRYLYPSKKKLDIFKYNSLKKYFKKHKPDLVIHCAALSRPMNMHDKEISKSIKTNIIGTSNLVCVCEELKVKIIYFSTNYIYPGTNGNYDENSPIKPINNYAWSKLGGESAVQMYKNSLILRICMTENPFIHKFAYKNLITNFIFHEEIAKLLPKLYSKKGIINVGGKSQSVYKFAKNFNPKIKGISLRKKNKITKLDASMNTRKFNKIIK